MNRRTFSQLFSYFLASWALTSCTRRSNSSTVQGDGSADERLQIWWEEGFYPEEIDAVTQVITQWEEISGVKVNLTVIPQKDILQEVEQAVADGNPPDVLYLGVADLTIIPRLAWDNALADVSDVVNPQKDRYSKNALAGVSYQNKTLGDRSYSFPHFASYTING